MNLRRLAKKAEKQLRVARVQTLSLLRAAKPTRTALRLPHNALQPLRNDAEAGLTVHPVDPETPFERELPEMPGESEVNWLFRREQRGTIPSTYVAELQDGRFWSHYGGSVFCRNGRLIAELSKDVWGSDLHSAFAKFSFPKPRRLNGRVLSLVTPEAAGNYHHWTMDLLPRAGLATRAGYDLHSFNYILIKDRGLPYQREALARLGFDERKILRVDERSHFIADQLVVPAVRHDNTRDGLNDLLFTRRLYLDEQSLPVTPTRRLYVGRRDASFRRVTNENELMPLLQKHGFEEVAMSRMSVAEQAKLFSEAEVIVGPNGSALANLVFAHPSCRVLEFFAPGWIVEYNWMIAELLKLEYMALVGRGPRLPDGMLPHDVKQDIELDPALFAEALAKITRTRP
jgi:hypothetical protein